jgi:CRISPR-associated exonuclease Cas4
VFTVILTTLLLLFLAIVLFLQAARQRKKAGLPGGRVIYADTSNWVPNQDPLYDPELSLTGKPDYLIEQGSHIIPVEVKSSDAPQGPYDGHIFQLAAYCLLVQRVRGKRPDYGLLHYKNRTFRIDFTPELETNTLDLLIEMRANDRRKQINRSHASYARCKACGFRPICEQRLV